MPAKIYEKIKCPRCGREVARTVPGGIIARHKDPYSAFDDCVMSGRDEDLQRPGDRRKPN